MQILSCQYEKRSWQCYAHDLPFQRVSGVSTVSNVVFPYINIYYQEVTANLLQSSVNMGTMQFIISRLSKKVKEYKFSIYYTSTHLPLSGLHTFLLLDLF